jgi:hypothetical protein
MQNEVRLIMKLTDQTINIICKALNTGLSIRSSCSLANISESTYYRWYKENSDFRAAINKSHAEYEFKALSEIQEQGKKDWRAIAWVLERRHPESWSKNRTVKVQHSNTGHEVVLDMLRQVRDKSTCSKCS